MTSVEINVSSQNGPGTREWVKCVAWDKSTSMRQAARQDSLVQGKGATTLLSVLALDFGPNNSVVNNKEPTVKYVAYSDNFKTGETFDCGGTHHLLKLIFSRMGINTYKILSLHLLQWAGEGTLFFTRKREWKRGLIPT